MYILSSINIEHDKLNLYHLKCNAQLNTIILNYERTHNVPV